MAEQIVSLTSSFDALLICNGAAPDRTLLQTLSTRAGYIVCADGGANTARIHGILPDLIIGDFDSMTSENRSFFEERNVEFIHDNSQDNTDFEKALRHLTRKNKRTLVIVGVTGLLLDHTLGNFSILQRYVNDFRIVLIDPEYRIDVVTHDTTFASSPGERISIVPFPKATYVRYAGLLYPLDAEEMVYGSMEGTCNAAMDSSFSVSLNEGALLVFRPIRQPQS